MPQTRTAPRPRTAPPSAAPGRALDSRRLIDEALRGCAPAPEAPAWSHRLLPRSVRALLAELGMWHNPVLQKPSGHLEQVLVVLTRYGWCQSLDVSVTGRLCIRGAQNLLEKTGHVTPAAREKAVAYMQQTLGQAGIRMQFFAWNDLPDQQFSSVQALLTKAAHTARQNGE